MLKIKESKKVMGVKNVTYYWCNGCEFEGIHPEQNGDNYSTVRRTINNTNNISTEQVLWFCGSCTAKIDSLVKKID